MKRENVLMVVVCLVVLMEISPRNVYAQSDPGPRQSSGGRGRLPWPRRRGAGNVHGSDAGVHGSRLRVGTS